MQHRLYFLPLPQGHGSLRLILVMDVKLLCCAVLTKLSVMPAEKGDGRERDIQVIGIDKGCQSLVVRGLYRPLLRFQLETTRQQFPTNRQDERFSCPGWTGGAGLSGLLRAWDRGIRWGFLV